MLIDFFFNFIFEKFLNLLEFFNQIIFWFISLYFVNLFKFIITFVS